MEEKKVSKKEQIFNYLRENPNAKTKDIAKEFGIHHTYVSFVRRNAGVKKPKAVKKVVKKQEPRIILSDNEKLMMNSIANLRKENFDLKDTVIRLHGIIDYLEQKIEHATSV